MELHMKNLQSLCRVCTKRLGRVSYDARTPTAKESEKILLREAFGHFEQNPEIHPPRYCNSCYLTMKRMWNATEKGTVYRTSLSPKTWTQHTEGNCDTCSMVVQRRGGGRPPKATRSIQGCPSQLTHHIRSIAGQKLQSSTPLTIERFLPCGVGIEDLVCKVCENIVDEPVELTCKHLVCCSCVFQLLTSHISSLPCPQCHQDHQIAHSTFQSPSPIASRLLQHLVVKCENCIQFVYLKDLNSHVDSQCKLHTKEVKHTMTLQDVLQKPPDAPPSRLEMEAAGSVVRKMLAQSKSAPFSLPTGGHPITLAKVTKARVTSSDASDRSKRRRSSELHQHRDLTSGGEGSVQLQAEVKGLPESERQKLLSELKFKIEIPALTGLALKSDLCLPWNKMRNMKRWLAEQGIKISSEKKQRLLSKELITTEIQAEIAPFTHALKSGGEEVKPEAMAYIPYLPDKVFELLEQHASNDELTWHDGAIPSDEIWIKLGGDKGGGTFKMNFQIVNVVHPNSPANTCVFCIFLAYDSVTNLHIGLDRYADQLKDLQTMQWREKSIRIFVSGDYEVLCRLYGITGATGRHCCLLCHIKGTELKAAPSQRQQQPLPRDLGTLASALSDFNTLGNGNLAVAKEYFNVIAEPFFDIPLDQISIPGLHISLGIYYRLFSLLEDAVHCLDFQIAPTSQAAQQQSAEVEEFVKALKSLEELKEERERVLQRVTLTEQVLTMAAINNSANFTITPALVDAMVKEAAKLRKELNNIDKAISQAQTTADKGFKKSEGPFVKALDAALASFHVERQAYYSGTFVGNHVNRCLKPKNIDTLCKAVTDTAEKLAPELISTAESISRKFTQVFTLFAQCHSLYNSGGKMEEDDIELLDKNIKEFMAFYRTTFPDATVLPKMHLMEAHMVPWLRKWGVGLGLMAEQGAESIHASINSIKGAYSNIPDRVERLRCILQEHHRHACPVLAAQRPIVKKRKRNKTDEE